MVQKGCGIIFFSPTKNAVLVFLRDDKFWIPFPNMLDIIGGEVEDDECPEAAIIRETAEELFDRRVHGPYVLHGHKPVCVYKDKRGCEQNIFSKDVDFEIGDIDLLEGQKLVWLTDAEVADGVKLAFEFEEVLAKFFARKKMQKM